MKNFILPEGEQIKELMKMGYDGPIYMINLLKFKPDGGAESYKKYIEESSEVFMKVGVRLIFRGDITMPVIGNEEWDEIIVAEYPSISAFMEMNRNRDYQKSVTFRTEALIDSRLYLVRADQASMDGNMP